MGFLKLFNKAPKPLMRLPEGSFTMDRNGRVVVATLPSSFPAEMLEEIGHLILKAFQDARALHLSLSEINIHYGSLKITARELRGGTLVFLSPITPITAASNN